MQLNKRIIPETIYYLQVFSVTKHSCFCPPGEQLLCSVHIQHDTNSMCSVHIQHDTNSMCSVHIQHDTNSMCYGPHITMAAAKQTSDVFTAFNELTDGENDIGM